MCILLSVKLFWCSGIPYIYGQFEGGPSALSICAFCYMLNIFGVVVFLLEDQSRRLWHHFMMSQGSLVLLREGTMKGECNWTLGLLSSGSSDTKHLGLLTSHRPSTLAIPVPLMEQSITRMDHVICLSICMYPDFSGELLVSVTLVVWH